MSTTSRNELKTMGRSKRKRGSKSSSSDAINDHFFPLLFAAISKSLNPSSISLITRCLTRLRLSLLSRSVTPRTLPAPILSLLPILLRFECVEIAALAAEIVGAASLFSLEMNEQIASDVELVKALVSALSSSTSRTVMATCNAVLDLSATSTGQQQLIRAAAIDHLMFVFFQVPKSSPIYVSLYAVDNGSCTGVKIGFKEDELVVLLLNATIMLINVCNLMQLEKISRTFCENFLVSVKELWRKVHEQILAGSIVDCREEKHYYVSNIRTSDLAESIFRLSINDNRLNEDLPVEKVKGRIFGSAGSSFEDFMVNHWEESPLIIQNLAAHSNHETDIFNSILSPLCSVGSVPSFLSAMLRNLVSCDPIASDELDILDFLKGLRSKMGFPIIYQQDIRVVRMERHLKRETHFFQESFRSSCTVESQYFKVNDILKCEKGYEEGYTIALRGMEFRFKSIAAIADILASLFGQPSVGANMYLTPPCSQGLIRHYDDHCVFVCQMCGSKQWTVYYPPKVGLPRLYDTLDGLHDSEVESKLVVFGQFLLTEGDVLYIPRGFPHEASTHNDDSIGSRTFSLHLTFGVEVEPPFEWEGFAHVALYLWSQNQNHSHPSFESLSGIYHAISVDLLHIAIGLMGISDNIFRKACLAAAISLPSDTVKWLDLNQRTVFRELLDKINMESNFLEVLGIIEVAIKKKEDPFHRLRWLQLLNVEGINRKEHEWNIPSMRIEDFFPFCQKHKDTIEGTFMKVKSSFCSEASFDTVLECYKILLERYRKVRKQYTRGMISLH